MIETNTEYDIDLHLWSEHQAQLLRNREFDKLDIINMIEEIESLGRSEERTLESHLTIQMIHMLKVKYQSEKYTRSWDLSIKGSNINAKKVLRKNPSLKSKLKDILYDAYSTARNCAAQETGLEEEIFPEECPWTIEDLKINEV